MRCKQCGCYAYTNFRVPKWQELCNECFEVLRKELAECKIEVIIAEIEKNIEYTGRLLAIIKDKYNVS